MCGCLLVAMILVAWSMKVCDSYGTFRWSIKGFEFGVQKCYLWSQFINHTYYFVNVLAYKAYHLVKMWLQWVVKIVGGWFDRLFVLKAMTFHSPNTLPKQDAAQIFNPWVGSSSLTDSNARCMCCWCLAANQKRGVWVIPAKVVSHHVVTALLPFFLNLYESWLKLSDCQAATRLLNAPAKNR